MKGQIIKEVKPFTKEQAEFFPKNYNMGASSEELAEKERKNESRKESKENKRF